MVAFASSATGPTDPCSNDMRADRAAARVLVVEDTDALRLVVARALRSEGYAVAEARHGAHALDVIERAAEPFDLVLTDVTMPVMTGYKLGRLLAHTHPSLPVLYMSSAPSAALVRCGLPAGPIPFLRKPFLPEELVREVALLIGRPAYGGTSAPLVS
jgi:CheY-like chemotaxis protein